MEAAERILPKTLRWGLMLTLVSYIFAGLLLAPVALILISISIAIIAKNPEAYKGMILAIVFIPCALFSGAKSVFSLLDVFAKAQPEIEYRRTAVKSLERAKIIRLACFEYAVSHEGKFPNTLVELVDEGYLDSMDQLESPLSADPADPNHYEILLPGAIAEDHASLKTPLIRDPFTASDGRQVTVYTDGSGGAYVQPANSAHQPQAANTGRQKIMGQKLPPHQNELYKRTDEVLLYMWDPIGVAGIPEARDEYYSYLPHVFSLLVNPSKEGDIGEYLLKIEGEAMGLSITQRSKDKAKEIEDIIRNYKEVIYERAQIETQ